MTKYILIILMLCSTLARGEEKGYCDFISYEGSDYAKEDKSIYRGEDIRAPDSMMVFSWMEDGGSEEYLRIQFNGDIFYKGRLITTDKDLTKAFYALISNYRCPKCGRLLDNYTTKDR